MSESRWWSSEFSGKFMLWSAKQHCEIACRQRGVIVIHGIKPMNNLTPVVLIFRLTEEMVITNSIHMADRPSLLLVRRSETCSRTVCRTQTLARTARDALWRFLSALLYVSKRGAYWDRLCRDVVGRLVRWLSRACTVAKRCILGL